MPSRPAVFTIPAGTPFLPTLADALLGGRLVPGWPVADDPLSLATATVYVPTRRAARALGAELALRSGGPVLLPRIVPLGDLEEAEETLLFEHEGGGDGAGAMLPPPVSESARRIVLGSMALAWAKAVDHALRIRAHDPLLVPASPADALALAADLGRLVDSLAIHGKTWDDVHRLVPGDFDRYWAITRDFLAIAAETWPRWCEETGVLDAAARRHLLLTTQAETLARTPQDAPVIAAGSTGSMPATAALLAAIARLPRGDPSSGVPGDPGHPQALLAALLRRLGVDREEVSALASEPPALAARAALVSEALLPADMTHLWQSRADRLPPAEVSEALDGVTVVEADDDREEAVAIAVALREALETPGRTAALVTPDRGLAERVRAELRRWQVEVDDSAGLPLGRSVPGLFARLLADTLCGSFDGEGLLALLAHPYARFGLSRRTVLQARTALEIGVLRGPVVPPGIEALRAAARSRRVQEEGERWPRPRKQLADWDWAALDDVLDRLESILAAFRADSGDIELPGLAPRHEAALVAAAAPAPGEDELLFSDTAGEALASLFDELSSAPASSLTGRKVDYPAFFDGLMAGRVVRPTAAGHRRVTIWGLLEARLLSADLLVLGGLDEKTWPPETRADAFLNRPMRDALGLPAPERRIGQTAHDFASAMGAPQVVLARAGKSGGNPTVASRFLQRLAAVAGETAWREAVARGNRLLHLARELDRPPTIERLGAPAPVPAPALVPRRFSVTEIETLVRDPYAIFAQKVLGLDPLDPIGTLPGAADRGTLVHEILGRFAQDHPETLPADVYDRLVALADEAFAGLGDHPDVQRFWWPRVLRMAGFMAAFETQRRPGILRVVAERRGEVSIPLGPGDEALLSARADRLELTRDGGLAVVDYKTGSPPGAREVQIGFAPQLTLEAAMARRGAFADVPRDLPVAQLLYVKLSGGSKPGEELDVSTSRNPCDPHELAEQHWQALGDMLRDYVLNGRPFRSRPYAKYAKRFAPYDHLARVKEWSLAGDDDAENGA
jgi:ATP-dependent helicase/nuclease subunit B